MNPHRGEVAIPFGTGRTLTVRPDFSFIAAVESATGKPVMTLAKSFMTADFSIRDMVAILLAAGKQGNPEFTHAEACTIMDEEGMNVYVTPFMNLLTNALRGSKSAGASSTKKDVPTTGEGGRRKKK